jgi:hypothetical protein
MAPSRRRERRKICSAPVPPLPRLCSHTTDCPKLIVCVSWSAHRHGGRMRGRGPMETRAGLLRWIPGPTFFIIIPAVPLACLGRRRAARIPPPRCHRPYISPLTTKPIRNPYGTPENLTKNASTRLRASCVTNSGRTRDELSFLDARTHERPPCAALSRCARRARDTQCLWSRRPARFVTIFYFSLFLHTISFS